jgi:ethanolamine utilization protein EutA
MSAHSSPGTVLLAGLDFGSTTSSLLVMRATLRAHGVSGRMELADAEVLWHPEPVFTPFVDGAVDLAALEVIVDGWLRAAPACPDGWFSGGALVTGLAARGTTADAIRRFVRHRVGNAVVAATDDPCLESWLAFQGSVGGLHHACAGRAIVHLDIGGGTTNSALGEDGAVLSTGCHFIGARHFRFAPGTWRITGLSPHGEALAAHVGAAVTVGADLSPDARERILDWYVTGLEAIVRGDPGHFADPTGRLHEQVPFAGPAPGADAVVTFSGGVGALVYRLAAGQSLPGTTAYGDLGIDLARRIVASPLLARDIARHVPANAGRATVTGLTLHGAEVSGATLFLPDPALLPLADLPIVARLPLHADAAAVDRAAGLVARSATGGCLHWPAPACAPDPASVRLFAGHLRDAMAAWGARVPLVVLTSADAGKTLGHYATDWGRRPAPLIVIDEVPDRHAHFAQIGRLREGVVTVAFHGIRHARVTGDETVPGAAPAPFPSVP